MVDDEIFQGVSFAAVKEQLLLLGHDLPDHVILAYLDEGSAAGPRGPQTTAQRGGNDGEGVGPASATCSSAADSGRDPFADLSAAEADALDRASSEPCDARRSAGCGDEDLLAALRLSSKVGALGLHNKMHACCIDWRCSSQLRDRLPTLRCRVISVSV